MLRRMKQGVSGFSLLELMAAITVLGVLLGLAVPGFREFTRQNRATAAQNDLATALNLARSEALRRSTQTSICASANGTTCGTAASWRTGWLVFSDSTGGMGALDAPGDEVVQRWTSSGTDVTFSVTPGPSGISNVLTFRADGTNALDERVRVDVVPNSCVGKKRLRTTVSAAGSIQATREDC